MQVILSRPSTCISAKNGNMQVGSPLLGDMLYGGKTVEGGGAGRALLHAWRVVFRQPFDGREIEVESPVPGDMAGYFGHSARWERDQ